MDNTFLQSFSVRLREVRKEMGLTQAEFAEKCKIARGSMTYYESTDAEKARLPDAETLQRICRTTGISSDYFLGLTDEKKEYDLNISKVCNYLGLSRETVLWLNSLNNGEDLYGSKTLDFIFRSALHSDNLIGVISGFGIYCDMKKHLQTAHTKSISSDDDSEEFAYCKQRLASYGYVSIHMQEYLSVLYESTILPPVKKLVEEVSDLYLAEE